MCGIAGVVDLKASLLDIGIADTMTDAIHDISHDYERYVLIGQGWRRDGESV